MKLDLGGTQEEMDVSISLDGTHIDDEYDFVVQPDGSEEIVYPKEKREPTPRVQGDYTRCPFPDNSFDEARGCCVLEADNNEYVGFYKEMHRILKHGGKLWVRGCDRMHSNHTAHAAGSGLLLSETGGNAFRKEYDEGLTFINIKL
jgi:SAM-dependent methyltransferase